MEPQAPATPPATSQPSEPSQTQPPQPVSSLPPSSSLIPSISAPLNPTPNPNSIQNQNQNQNQIPNSKPPTPLPHPSAQTPPQPRPPTTFNRNLPSQSQQQSPYSHFSSSVSSLPPSSAPASSGSSFTSTGSPSISGAPAPRAAMAIGVPAHHQIQSPPFSTSFGQHFGLGRTGVNVPDPASNSNNAQVRAPMQGMGMLGSLGSNSQMRPGVIPAHQQRPVQSSLRSPSAQNNQSSGSQVHGLMRAPSVGSPTLSSPSASQSMQSLSQPWLSSGSPGKPPLPSPSYRQQLNSQSLQQRSHISPQLHSTATVSQQQQQLQCSPSYHSQEHFGQQVPSSRALHVPHQQQVMRVQGPGNQKPAPLLAAQPSAVQPGTQNRLANPDTDETCNRILSKRTIHELVNQVDPLEKLDPEVEEILMDVAEIFFESITRSGCSLAIHRKSTTLEAKDILLHLEKTWNITLPGFGGDEIKSYKRQLTSDIHKDRLTVIRKSMVTTEAALSKGSAGQASGSAKGTLAKTHLNVIGSPNLKNS